MKTPIPPAGTKPPVLTGEQKRKNKEAELKRFEAQCRAEARAAVAVTVLNSIILLALLALLITTLFWL